MLEHDIPMHSQRWKDKRNLEALVSKAGRQAVDNVRNHVCPDAKRDPVRVLCAVVQPVAGALVFQLTHNPASNLHGSQGIPTLPATPNNPADFLSVSRASFLAE